MGAPLSTRRCREVLKKLRRDFPAPAPVRVRFCDLGLDTYGVTGRGPRAFSIRLNNRRPFCADVETLLHEWAHVLTWDEADRGDHHGPMWAVQQAEIMARFDGTGRYEGREPY